MTRVAASPAHVERFRAVLRERLGLRLEEVASTEIDAWDVRVDALDVNLGALSRAAEAEYGEWSLRAAPDALRRRWFHASGKAFRVDPRVKRMVAFNHANLASTDAPLAVAGGYDAVFCRNVLMYFTARTATSVVQRLHDALAPLGFLFVAHAESLRGVSEDFELRSTHDTFYYQRRDARASSPRGATAKAARALETTVVVVPASLGVPEAPEVSAREAIARATTALQEAPALRDIPAVLVTSRAGPEDRARGREVGAVEYIAKGAFDQLFESVARELGPDSP